MSKKIIKSKKREVTTPRGKFIGQFMTKTKGDFGDKIFESYISSNKEEFQRYWSKLGEKLMKSFPNEASIKKSTVSSMECLSIIEKYGLSEDSSIEEAAPGSVREIKKYFSNYREFENLRCFKNRENKPVVLVFLSDLNEIKYNKFKEDLEEKGFSVAEYDKGDSGILIYL